MNDNLQTDWILCCFKPSVRCGSDVAATDECPFAWVEQVWVEWCVKQMDTLSNVHYELWWWINKFIDCSVGRRSATTIHSQPKWQLNDFQRQIDEHTVPIAYALYLHFIHDIINFSYPMIYLWVCWTSVLLRENFVNSQCHSLDGLCGMTVHCSSSFCVHTVNGMHGSTSWCEY